MPELPEVERARAHIEAHALGRTVASVEDSDTWVCRPHAPGEIASAIEGATLIGAHRQGEAMWVELDDGPPLGLDLGMTGRIAVDGDGAGGPGERLKIPFEDRGPLGLPYELRLGPVAP